MNWFLALAAFSVLGVIAVQNYLYPPLRNETISSGLTGPYHWWLDASYLALAAALVVSFTKSPLAEALAIVSAIALVLTAATNTFWKFWDKITGGNHSLWHSRFTIVVFTAALLLQVVSDKGKWGWYTLANTLLPGALYFILKKFSKLSISASPAAEKLYTLGLSTWLMFH